MLLDNHEKSRSPPTNRKLGPYYNCLTCLCLYRCESNECNTLLKVSIANSLYMCEVQGQRTQLNLINFYTSGVQANFLVH